MRFVEWPSILLGVSFFPMITQGLQAWRRKATVELCHFHRTDSPRDVADGTHPNHTSEAGLPGFSPSKFLCNMKSSRFVLFGKSQCSARLWNGELICTSSKTEPPNTSFQIILHEQLAHSCSFVYSVII